MKIQEFQVNTRDFGVLYELGQYDLLYTYGAIAHDMVHPMKPAWTEFISGHLEN